MKTSDEFLEELKNLVKKWAIRPRGWDFEADVVYVDDIIEEIEQFQSECKANENK